MSKTTDPFKATTTFCAKCGSILPLLQEFGSVNCYSCKAIYNAENFNNIQFNYTVNFNTVTSTTIENIVGEQPEGPVVERKCPKCGNDRMSYATLQLRSADEGQTVFYTCTKCKVNLQGGHGCMKCPRDLRKNICELSKKLRAAAANNAYNY